MWLWYFSSLLGEIVSHYADPSRPYPDSDNPLMYELSTYLEWAGQGSPLDKIYITAPPSQNIAAIIFIIIIANLSKLTYTKNLGRPPTRQSTFKFNHVWS